MTELPRDPEAERLDAIDRAFEAATLRGVVVVAVAVIVQATAYLMALRGAADTPAWFGLGGAAATLVAVATWKKP